MKKQPNKVLIIVLLVLVALFAATRIFRAPARESNLDKDVFSLDTSRIASVKFEHGDSAGIALRKTDGRWTVAKGSKSAAAEIYQVKSLLGALSNVQPERMVSRKKEKWRSYQLGDSAAFRMVAYDGDMQPLAEWRIGKETGGMTYMRREDDPEVYAVEGNLRTRFDKSFSEWRDKTFLRIKRNLVNKISFRYPADSGFVLEKNGDTWMIGGQKADSAKVENYLERLQSRDLSQFADDQSPGSEPDVTLSIEGTGMPATEVKGWKRTGDKWILTSTAQKGVYFSDSTFVNDLFIGKKALAGK